MENEYSIAGITFTHGDEKILCTVRSIYIGEQIQGLIDSSMVEADGDYIISPNHDKISELHDIIENNLPDSPDWYSYEYGFVFKDNNNDNNKTM